MCRPLASADQRRSAKVVIGRAQPPRGVSSYVAARPIYKGPGEGKIFSVAQVRDLANDMAWLQVRLHSHLYTDKFIKNKRASLWGTADHDLPAPWLGKLPRQDPTPSRPRATRKSR